jgi:hypothetical protein
MICGCVIFFQCTVPFNFKILWRTVCTDRYAWLHKRCVRRCHGYTLASKCVVNCVVCLCSCVFNQVVTLTKQILITVHHEHCCSNILSTFFGLLCLSVIKFLPINQTRIELSSYFVVCVCFTRIISLFGKGDKRKKHNK